MDQGLKDSCNLRLRQPEAKLQCFSTGNLNFLRMQSDSVAGKHQEFSTFRLLCIQFPDGNQIGKEFSSKIEQELVQNQKKTEQVKEEEQIEETKPRNRACRKKIDRRRKPQQKRSKAKKHC